MNEGAIALLGSLLALAGALFFLTAAIGLMRLPDFYCRVHAPTKAASLGVLLCALGSVLLRDEGGGFELEKLVLVLFVLLTAPVSAQLLTRGAIARGAAQAPGTRGRPGAGPLERIQEGVDPGPPGPGD